MSLERPLVWAAALATTVVFWLAYTTTPALPGRLVIAVLGGLVVLPVCVVLAGYLYSRRDERRGWS